MSNHAISVRSARAVSWRHVEAVLWRRVELERRRVTMAKEFRLAHSLPLCVQVFLAGRVRMVSLHNGLSRGSQGIG